MYTIYIYSYKHTCIHRHTQPHRRLIHILNKHCCIITSAIANKYLLECTEVRAFLISDLHPQGMQKQEANTIGTLSLTALPTLITPPTFSVLYFSLIHFILLPLRLYNIVSGR